MIYLSIHLSIVTFCIPESIVQDIFITPKRQFVVQPAVTAITVKESTTDIRQPSTVRNQE